MALITDNSGHDYDVIIVGAGPAGCEAAFASSLLGARTLCLSINLDTTGFPPGSPVLVEGEEDKQGHLLEEMHILGMILPKLLLHDNACDAGLRVPAGASSILVDRRELGLSYKENLESTKGLHLRQALITSITQVEDGWLLTSRLDERFKTACVVIAAGTFLEGKVFDNGNVVPGGRRGEIPSNALAASLKELGFKFQQASATSATRFDSRTVSYIAGARVSAVAAVYADGSQLNESYFDGSRGTYNEQYTSPRHWVTRNPYSVNHLILQAGQFNQSLEAATKPGLFFSGRAAGCSSYLESAVLGSVAGHNAAFRAKGKETEIQLDEIPAVARICQLVANQVDRPVSLTDTTFDFKT